MVREIVVAPFGFWFVVVVVVAWGDCDVVVVLVDWPSAAPASHNTSESSTAKRRFMIPSLYLHRKRQTGKVVVTNAEPLWKAEVGRQK